MNDKLIDVWDLATFDPELIAILTAEADTIRGYMVRDHEIFLAHELGQIALVEVPVSRACARDLGVASEGVPCAVPNHRRHRRRTVARACGGYVAGGFELGGHIAQ